MHANHLLRRVPAGMFLLCICTLLVAACGSAPTASAGADTASATATAVSCSTVLARVRGASGTLQSVNGNTLVLTDRQGKSVSATYTDKTRFTRESTVTPAALQEGLFVTAGVTQNADNTYTATRITLVNRNNAATPGANPGRGQQRNNPCFTQRRTGTPTTRNPNNNNNARAITGTVGQLSGNTLTITATNGNDFTVTLAPSTQIIQTKQASASDLKAGMNVNIAGTTNSQGVVTAQTVMIVLSTSSNSSNS